MNIIGTTFPAVWQYGPEEIQIFQSTADQIAKKFAGQRNLLINTTWFGPQFDNKEWQRLLNITAPIDNLFLLSVIDPLYWDEASIVQTQQRLQVKNTYRIGMFADSAYEWNFHAFATDKLVPKYNISDIKLVSPDWAFLLYQRKPRPHRIELTNLLLERNLNTRGIITLGSNKNSSYDWSEGQTGPVLTIEDNPSNYKHHGSYDDFDGVPNDLVSLGRLDIWQRHFLNVISETEFNNWQPRFVTEKTWKPILGLRPFVIHGHPDIYRWLESQGFRTFKQYWPDIDITNDQHGHVMSAIETVSNKATQELLQMYQDMLPDLQYNRNRFFEFAAEQQYKIDHLFK